jgi:NTE family protein
LVLSGGGAKGLAQLGLLSIGRKWNTHRLYNRHLKGAIVGSLYAAGYSPQEMEKIVTDPEFQNWLGVKFPMIIYFI